ncbi:hypothetical protein UPYG_G00201270 [Umbra pygmaea]|uniref:Uncharacterized protein n=1 Tax=Umbra pygmaea TaxID=75934 RepID=A0ABD0WJV3_UMBPY
MHSQKTWESTLDSRLRTNADGYEAKWSEDEVHAFLTSWASTNVQEELLSTVRNARVFAHLSSELNALGFKKTIKQCREKIKKLKQEYKKIKNDTSINCPNSCGKRWFAIMDDVLSQQTRTQVLLETNRTGTEDSDKHIPADSSSSSVTPDCQGHQIENFAAMKAVLLSESTYSVVKEESYDTFIEQSQSSLTPDCQGGHQIDKFDFVINSTLLSKSTGSILQVKMYDKSRAKWSAAEVHALVTSWASRSVQRELLSTVRNARVFARLRSNLAALGFKKTIKQCREKIKKLKQEYKKIKNDTRKRRPNSCVRRWFDIMDDVLSQQTRTPVLLETTNSPGTEESDNHIPADSSSSSMTPDGQGHQIENSADMKTVLLSESTHPIVQTEDYDKDLDKPQSSLTPDSQVSHQIENSDLVNSTESTDAILHVETFGEYQATWSADEVQALLTSWSSSSVQKELLSSNTTVFARLSSELAALGFKKTVKQCREKIKKLKQEYKKIKNGNTKNCSNILRKRWFYIMDAVLSQQTRTPVLLETTNRPDSGPQLPLPSLRLLAPPLRLMSAFMWQVSQQNNVKHYGKLEEFVTLVTEIVPEVLSSRQRTNLLLGLRAKMVLELCQTESTVDVVAIQTHLDKIHTLIECYVEKESNDELDITVSNFPDLVQSLLKDPSEREHFFQEVFPVHYGPHYDTALQKLVWEFLSQLEELLPVPDFTQTAAWLGSASSVLEECENTLLDPEAIKTLLQHHHHHHHHGNLKKRSQHGPNDMWRRERTT